MPTMLPIIVVPGIAASLSDMLDFHWTKHGVKAWFIIPGDPERALRVAFAGQCIVRLLDEMALSTEHDNGPAHGLINEHFAYRVEGARFWDEQSEAFKAVHAQAAHYRFVTGWTCMDVICPTPPRFSAVPVETIRRDQPNGE